MARITRIVLYPIKSLDGISVVEARVSAQGALENDRPYAIVDAQGRFVNGKRVLGGFESSWKWEEGVDVANPDSHTPSTEEAGIFQCSGNSMSFDATLKALLLQATGQTDCKAFNDSIVEVLLAHGVLGGERAHAVEVRARRPQPCLLLAERGLGHF